MKSIEFLFVILAMMLTVPAYAGHHGEGDGDGEHKGCKCGGGGGGYLASLELTEEQQASIDALKEAKHADKAELHEQGMALHAEFEALWAADEIDRDAVMATAEELMDIKTAAHQRKLQFKLDLLEVLNPEQRAAAKEHMAAKMGAEAHGEHGSHGAKGCSCDKDKGCTCDKDKGCTCDKDKGGEDGKGCHCG